MSHSKRLALNSNVTHCDSSEVGHSHNSLESNSLDEGGVVHEGVGGHGEADRRIEDEVTDLVDCGGRDLGFCDMNSRYPGSVLVVDMSFLRKIANDNRKGFCGTIC